MPILQVYRLFPSRTAILCGLFRRIDEAVLAAPVEAAADERPRDRVFDLLMRRFDALQPYRGALYALRRDHPATRHRARGGRRAALLDTADARSGGDRLPRHRRDIVVKLTAAVYVSVTRIWARDESPDLAPTMAALDRRLRGIERWLVPGRRRPGEREAAEA